jgi:hypothetical protein
MDANERESETGMANVVVYARAHITYVTRSSLSFIGVDSRPFAVLYNDTERTLCLTAIICGKRPSRARKSECFRQELSTANGSRGRRLSELVLVLSHHQDGTRSVAHNSFSGAAHKDMLETGMAVGRDHD